LLDQLCKERLCRWCSWVIQIGPRGVAIEAEICAVFCPVWVARNRFIDQSDLEVPRDCCPAGRSQLPDFRVVVRQVGDLQQVWDMFIKVNEELHSAVEKSRVDRADDGEVGRIEGDF
jgi:hypothetical protein